MNIAIIDADLVGRKKHRFPNLTCMKLSSFYKKQNNNVVLKTDFSNLENYDKVFIAKVFTDTYIDDKIINLSNVEFGGTGFFYDKAKPLPYEIEHIMPDYDLYNEWLIDKDVNKPEFKYYKDYSIGFLTRGCFRHCSFCVNKNYNKVELNSPLNEFLDLKKRKICLLDDNFFGYKDWKNLLQELQDTNKKFQFKQGLDERLLTQDKCEMLFNSNYDGDYIFAFDNIEDKDLIEEKLKLIRKYTNKIPKFYVLCGYDREQKYNQEFWIKDIKDVFSRIDLLIKYRCLPYIMRHKMYVESPYRGIYVTLAQWCNQPSIFKKKTLRGFIDMTTWDAPKRYMEHFIKTFPNAEYYLDNIKFE